MTTRTRILAWLLAAPALIAALALIALEAWRLRAPDSPLFATPFAYSLADAIARDDVPRAYAFIRAGQSPNEPIAVRHPELTHDETRLVSPLLWAVATDARQSVLMLLGYGAQWDAATERSAACVADALDRKEMADLLARYRRAPAPAVCDGVDIPFDGA